MRFRNKGSLVDLSTLSVSPGYKKFSRSYRTTNSIFFTHERQGIQFIRRVEFPGLVGKGREVQ